jgi:hypothetical protein
VRCDWVCVREEGKEGETERKGELDDGGRRSDVDPSLFLLASP